MKTFTLQCGRFGKVTIKATTLAVAEATVRRDLDYNGTIRCLAVKMPEASNV